MIQHPSFKIPDCFQKVLELQIEYKNLLTNISVLIIWSQWEFKIVQNYFRIQLKIYCPKGLDNPADIVSRCYNIIIAKINNVVKKTVGYKIERLL